MVRTIRKVKGKTARIIGKRMFRKGRPTLARDKIRRKRITCVILTMAILLIIIPGYMILRHKFNTMAVNQEQTVQNQELYSVAGIIYRHMNAYPTYCRKAGYTMEQYPKTFMSEYEDDLIVFGQVARQIGLSPEGVINQTARDFSTVVQKSIGKEFTRLRKRGLTTQDNQSVQTDEEICRHIDENAANWIKNEKKSDTDVLQNFVRMVKEKNK